jgi:hypothetical protein
MFRHTGFHIGGNMGKKEVSFSGELPIFKLDFSYQNTSKNKT